MTTATYARGRFFLFIACCHAYACGSNPQSSAQNEPQTVKTSKGAFTLPSPALADGRGLEGMHVNVWTTPERTRVNCRVRDGEPLVLSRARHNVGEGRYYFELTAMNGCKGWVPDTFVRPDPEVRR